MALALPALDHPMPDEADHLTKGETARWSLGAGTALALRLGHRIADDIDIFVTGIALGELAPSRNPDTRAIRPHAQWPGHYLKVEGDEGEIDFLSSALQTTPGFSVELFRGRAVALDPAGRVRPRLRLRTSARDHMGDRPRDGRRTSTSRRASRTRKASRT